MSMSHVIAAVVSGELDLDGATSMVSTSLCRVCLNDDHKTLQRQYPKQNVLFIQTCSRNFSY